MGDDMFDSALVLEVMRSTDASIPAIWDEKVPEFISFLKSQGYTGSSIEKFLKNIGSDLVSSTDEGETISAAATGNGLYDSDDAEEVDAHNFINMIGVNGAELFDYAQEAGLFGLFPKQAKYKGSSKVQFKEYFNTAANLIPSVIDMVARRENFNNRTVEFNLADQKVVRQEVSTYLKNQGNLTEDTRLKRAAEIAGVCAIINHYVENKAA